MSTPEQKLKRFLHYGKELPVYQPGMRYNNNVYSPKELQSIGALIASEKYSDIAACIVKAFSDGYSAHPEMLIYALALCTKEKTVPLTMATYKAIKTVCVTPENLFLFIKYATKLYPNGSVFTTGFRKLVKEWYLKKDAKTLAEMVTIRKKYHGWSHKDVMKLIHIKSEDPAKSAIIKYVLYDIATAKKEYGEIQGTGEVLNYLQSIEDFRHLTDEQQAARMLESLNLTLEHIPCHLLKNREIWNSLVKNLPLGVLINNLERMGYLGFLKPNSPLVSSVLDALRDERSIAESHLHPAQVFIALKKYESSSKFVASENAQKKRKTENRSDEARKVVKVPPKPNLRIVVALSELFVSTSKLFLAPTGLRYLVAMNLKAFSKLAPSEKCHRCPYVSPSEAAVITTLCLLNADQSVDVQGSSDGDKLERIPLRPNMTIHRAIDELYEALRSTSSTSHLTLTKVLEWATKTKPEFDVILYITEFIHRTDKNVHSTLNQYRAGANLPNAKLITLSLTSRFQPTWASTSDDPGMFDITGFDGNVPRIIEAFSRGAF